MDKIVDKVILKLYVKDKYLNPHIEFIYSDKNFKTKDPIDNEREIAYKCEKASLFEMVAEECAELSHVSSKIARYLRGDQPVNEDFNIMVAFTNFLEEFADVYLAARVAQRSTDSFSYFNEKKFEELYYAKLERWIKRLNEKE